MTIEDLAMKVSRARAFYVRWRCRILGHDYAKFTTVHNHGTFRQSFRCERCKQVRVDGRKKAV